MTAISAVVAVIGLLQNSAALVVGSMVIAPLIGPAMAAAVGTVIDDHELATRGIRLQIIGLGLAIVSAAVFTARWERQRKHHDCNSEAERGDFLRLNYSL